MKHTVRLLTCLTAICLGPLHLVGATPTMPAKWKSTCALCHGKDGRGKTSTGRIMKVPDLTKTSYGQLTAERVRRAILDGVQGSNRQMRMQAYGASFTTEEVEAVVAYVLAIAPQTRSTTKAGE